MKILTKHYDHPLILIEGKFGPLKIYQGQIHLINNQSFILSYSSSINTIWMMKRYCQY